MGYGKTAPAAHHVARRPNVVGQNGTAIPTIRPIIPQNFTVEISSESTSVTAENAKLKNNKANWIAMNAGKEDRIGNIVPRLDICGGVSAIFAVDMVYLVCMSIVCRWCN